MNGMNGLSTAAAELAHLSMEMSPADLAQLTRLTQLVKAASRPARDQAWTMLNAAPEPSDAAEVRARHATVIEYLERRAAAAEREQ